MESSGVYRQLQQRLDALPQRYPATASGIELRILERLFTPDDARIAVELSTFPEPASTIHKRMRGTISREALAEALDRMAARGLIHRVGRKGRARYLLAPFVVGFYERQLPWLTADFERELLQYFDEGLADAITPKKTAQMRTVPVGASLTPAHDVGSYDDVRAYVARSPGPFAVMNCICRLGRSLVGHTCEHTSRLETCLTFGEAAAGLAKSGVARAITRDEMLRLLDEADHDGLVLQPENTQDPLFICCCCGDCCGVLAAAKRLPEPAVAFATNFVARVDPAACDGCGTCLTRCRMDALSFDEGYAAVLATHCIGCGLCVGTCDPEAISLARTTRTHVPPKTTAALYVQLYRDRYGALGLATAAGKYLLGLKV